MTKDSWRTFRIERISVLNGRTVGSLTKAELRGLRPWLERVEQKWSHADKDIQNHFRAIKAAAMHAGLYGFSDEPWWNLYRRNKN